MRVARRRLCSADTEKICHKAFVKEPELHVTRNYDLQRHQNGKLQVTQEASSRISLLQPDTSMIPAKPWTCHTDLIRPTNYGRRLAPSAAPAPILDDHRNCAAVKYMVSNMQEQQGPLMQLIARPCKLGRSQQNNGTCESMARQIGCRGTTGAQFLLGSLYAAVALAHYLGKI